jgi:two-component system, cell cycle sensor histidine kinase and response regulator CckA
MAESQHDMTTLTNDSRLDAILKAAVDGIVTIDDRGKIESINPAGEVMFGYKSDELIGRNVSMLMPLPYRDEHDGYLQKYRDTGVRKIIGIGRQVVGMRKDGSQFPMDLSVSEFKIADKRMFAGFVRDLTERERAEEIEQSLGRIVEESLNEIFIFDIATLKFIQVNRGARENTGYSMDELQMMTPLDIKPQFTRGAFDEIIAPLVSGERERIVFESFHRRKDGSQYDAEIHLQTSRCRGKPCCVAIILDITERKRTEASLLVQRRALESAVNGILITDATQADNPIIYVNPSLEEITGYSADEVLGRNCRFLQNDDRDQAGIVELREAIEQERNCKVVLRNYRKDGTLFWNSLSVSPVRNADGALTNFVGIQADITERIEAEEALAHLNDELEHRVEERNRQLEEVQEQLLRREKLAVLGQLAGGVAHEIRNPLGVIKNAVYYLQQVQDRGDEDMKEAIGEIKRGVANSERIVSELIDFARGSKPEFTVFLLDDVVSSALEMVSLPSSIGVTLPEPGATRVRADRGQIERLLANLIQNAVQAMPEGGALSLRYQADGSRVSVAVCDTGTGIADDELEKIFEPLFTKRAKGIGLGLPLCRRYASQNGGTLTVESELGKGSTFTVTLTVATNDGQTL